MVIQRFEVYLAKLDPSIGAEMQKIRPCLVISPDQMHRHVRTVILAPLTSAQTELPTRVPCNFGGKTGEVALDQVRAVDRARLLKRLGRFDGPTSAAVRKTLVKMFA